jgi:type I restriction enzyme S subunit
MKRGRPDPVEPMDVRVPWPSAWRTLSLEELTDPVRTISYGILKPGPNVHDGVPYVRVVNMRGDKLDIAGLHRTAPDIAAAYDRASLRDGDVLISIRGTYGRVVEVPPELSGANITQDTARLAFLPAMLPGFAAIALRSPFVQNLLKRVARGVAVKGVNIGDLRTVPLPLPPIDEQLRIMARVAELISDSELAETSARSAQARSRALRKSLLEAAFSGNLTGASGDTEMVEEMAGV